MSKRKLTDNINECEEKMNQCDRYSNIYRMCDNFCNLTIIIGSAGVLVDGILQEESVYVRIISGCVIAIVKGISSLFMFRERGITYKILSIKYKKTVRKLTDLVQYKLSRMDVENTLNKIREDIDDLELHFYTGREMLKISNT